VLQTAIEYIEAHDTTFALLLIPIVVVLVTQWVVIRIDKQARIDRLRERQLARELQASNNYKESIELLREEMSEFISKLVAWRYTGKQDSWEVRRHRYKILLRLNPLSTRTKQFEQLSDEALSSTEAFPDFYRKVQALFELSRSIVQDNWSEMNSSLLTEPLE